MPRKRRFFIPDIPVHIVQRGRSRLPVFFEDEDYRAYLTWLKEAAERYRCSIHAYVLMTNHIHILATPSDKEGITRVMQYIGRYYVPFINHKYGESGSLWEGRYKASLVQEEVYLLTCMRYIELNPVRAQMVKTPGHYRWSSYRCNAQGMHDTLITAHALYQRLGRTVSGRLEAYKALFKAHIDEVGMAVIQSAWQTGTPLGNNYFKAQVEKKLRCKVGQPRRGRPTSGCKDTVKGL